MRSAVCTVLRRVLPLVLVLGVASPSFGQSGPSAHRIASVAWLTGCLEMRRGSRVVEEQRMPERAGTMIGMGRSVGARGLDDYELTVIQQEGDRLLYVAHPRRQPTATFVAIAATADSVLFENPEHDYPQRVGYRRIGTDSVLAWIDGTNNGKQQRVEFPYRRVPCPAAP